MRFVVIFSLVLLLIIQKRQMSLKVWQDVFTAKGLDDCVKHVKDADVSRWTEGGLSPEDLPDMLEMVLENAGTRQQFAFGNMMLGAKLDKAAAKTQPQVKNEAIIVPSSNLGGRYILYQLVRNIGD